MYLKQVNKILLTSMISICTANVAFASNKTSDIIHEVTSYEESAYGPLKGYIAKKSSTGSKMDLDIKEIPQSVSVITNDMMKTRNTQTIQNTTSYTSSITQIYGENGDTTTNYGYIIGIGQIYKSSFLDGLKLGYYSFTNPKTDMYAVEKVEILKGPASVLYGASSPGGLLNLQSKKANNNNNKEIIISINDKKSKSISLDINNIITEDLSLRLTGKFTSTPLTDSSYNDEKLYFFNPSIKYYINDNTSIDILASFAKDIMPGAGIASGAGHVLTYHKEISKYQNVFSQGNPVVASMIEAAAQKATDANLSNSLIIGNNSDILERKTISLSTLLNHKINDSLEINSNIRVSKLDGKYLNSFFDGKEMSTFISSFNYTNIPLSQSKYVFDLETLAMDNNIQYKWNTSNVENTSMFGLDIQVQEANKKMYRNLPYNLNLLNPDYSKNIGTHTNLLSKENEKLKPVALYVQNQAKINEKIILSTALRYDKVKKESKDTVLNTSSTQNDNNISGRIGLAYIFDNGFTPYASYSTSFSTNPGTGKNGKSYIPSIGKQFEIGAKYKLKQFNTFISAAAYKIEETNILTTDPQDDNFSIQESSSDIKGLEFDITMEPINNLNMIISLSKISAKEVNPLDPKLDGSKITSVPDMSASLWSDYTIKKTKIGDLKFGAGLKYIGKIVISVKEDFDILNGSPTTKRKVDAYTLVDAMIGTKYKDINFAFNVANIFDKQARVNPASTQYSLTSGRSYNFSLKYGL